MLAGTGQRITVTGYTQGPLFSNSAVGSTDIFAVELDQDLLCSIPPSTAPQAFQSEAAGSTVGTTVTSSVGVSIAASTAAVLFAPASTALSGTVGLQVASGASAGGALAYMMIFQLQFIATTTLIDANQSNQFKAFTDKLQWSNLWWSADILVADGR